jgi:hypothetical protein
MVDREGERRVTQAGFNMGRVWERCGEANLMMRVCAAGSPGQGGQSLARSVDLVCFGQARVGRGWGWV